MVFILPACFHPFFSPPLLFAGVQRFPSSHWPSLRVLILVISDAQKDVSSTTGMQDSVRTSPLLAFRADQLVEERLERMKGFYAERDFQGFAELTMQDSNQFHATCQDTYPPIFYMNETSRDVVRMISQANRDAEAVKFGYTFDAGSNAVLFCEQEDLPELVRMVQARFFSPNTDMKALIRTSSLRAELDAMELPTACNVRTFVKERFGHGCCCKGRSGGVSSLILTQVGEGAHRDEEGEHLVDPQTGEHRDLGKSSCSVLGHVSWLAKGLRHLLGFGTSLFLLAQIVIGLRLTAKALRGKAKLW